jgi:hypothetical protein
LDRGRKTGEKEREILKSRTVQKNCILSVLVACSEY